VRAGCPASRTWRLESLMETRFALLTSRTISDPIELDYEVHEIFLSR
jgi:hypothetical protein